MIIDSKKIIADTLEVFHKSQAQKKKFSEITDYVSTKDYQQLHKSFLTPTFLKINCNQFLKEIEQYADDFEQWGTQHTHLLRYGLALVNQDGKIKKNDAVNGSLYEWNVRFPENPIIESDCLIPTEVMTLESLRSLSVLDGHWCRSNILKWQSRAEFKPHIDTVVPSPWIRLWGTTNPKDLEIRYDNGHGELVTVANIEAGRIYIIDTSLVHDAVSLDHTVYQLFLSVLPSSINILKDLTCRA
jgi:hypothetical protein